MAFAAARMIMPKDKGARKQSNEWPGKGKVSKFPSDFLNF